MSIPLSTGLEISRDDGYVLSTDRTKLDLNMICEWISTDCYWAIGRPYEVIRGSIGHSLPFGVYTSTQDRESSSSSSSGDMSSWEKDSWRQVAFARVVTDYCILLIPLHTASPHPFSCPSPSSPFTFCFRGYLLF